MRNQTEDILQIDEEPNLPAGAVHLLEKVIWGTEGARYTLKDLEPTLRHLPNPTYLTLHKDQQFIGLRMILEKQALSGDRALHSFYHSFFAVDPAEKGKGYGKKLAQVTVESLRRKLGTRGLIYCHVETDNLRSLKIAESLGYERAGSFSAMTFSCFFPKSSPLLTKLAPDQQTHVLRKLNEQYIGHALTDFTSSLSADSYYVLELEGRLLAGVQVEPQRWKIHSLSGAGGAVALYALPKIPLLRDLFNPQNFRFLKFGNMFFEKNHPVFLHQLLEAVLAEHRLKTGMMFWDKTSPVFHQFASAGPFGILNSLTETPVHVMALFQGFDSNEIVDFSRHPKVISPSDI